MGDYFWWRGEHRNENIFLGNKQKGRIKWLTGVERRGGGGRGRKRHARIGKRTALEAVPSKSSSHVYSLISLRSISLPKHSVSFFFQNSLFLFCFFFSFYFPYKQTPFFLCGFWQQFSWNLDIGMAGNEWINGYLEAILVSGASAIEDSKATPIALREGGHFNPTKYFVEEVVTGVDETDLHRTWIKVVATRNTRERSSRLENMCWRIWHLARKKKQVLVFLDSFSLFLLIYIGVCWFSCVQALF